MVLVLEDDVVDAFVCVEEELRTELELERLDKVEVLDNVDDVELFVDELLDTVIEALELFVDELVRLELVLDRTRDIEELDEGTAIPETF